jgi:hypothetical protein
MTCRRQGNAPLFHAAAKNPENHNKLINKGLRLM